MQIAGMRTKIIQVSPNLLTAVRELPADLDTPVSTYLKLSGLSPSFLLESVSGGEQVARYSFIGIAPSKAFVLYGQTLECYTAQPGAGIDDPFPTIACQDCRVENVADPLEALRRELNHCHRPGVPGLPRFSGGLVGYLGYDMMRFFEPTVDLPPHPDLPDAIFFLADTLVAFDHAYGRLLLIANTCLEGSSSNGRQARAHKLLEARLEALQHRLEMPLAQASTPLTGMPQSPSPIDLGPDTRNEHDRYTDAVTQAKEYIAAGDIFQVVLSQRITRETTAQPFQIYRALRGLNPSPYMFYFDFDGLAGDPPVHLVGASPEVHVRLENGVASLRPIAGTRKRGQDHNEDLELERELLADPKERAEHVMLVDLGRNDLGRVCEYGSVHVPELMKVERYSHVMHIVSQVEGKLRSGYDAFDLLRATFPAGTVSGAPKIRAMQIIDELENSPRGPYAGAVGYISYDGALDTCIAIRTLVLRGQQVSIQAGAGIVADSDPEREYQETLNKAHALGLAIDLAENQPVQSAID
jgi:anthranilate synthase component 1